MIDNLKRLRNHPSIALWNGNNEVLIGWKEWGWQDNLTDSQRQTVYGWYLDIFNTTIRKTIEQYDADRFYWPTSPSNSASFEYDINQGDIHYWTVWGSKANIEDYNKFVGRFNSEYGMQSILSYQSIKKFTIESDRHLSSHVLQIHERHVTGWQNIQFYMNQYYKEPQSLKQYVYASQCMQAYAIQTAIQALRSKKPYCSGSLYWQINDVWPVVSWSSVDFYGNWKGLHYRGKHFYSDIIGTLQEEGDYYNLRIVSDLYEQVQIFVSVYVVSFEGSILENLIDKISFTLKENSNTVIKKIFMNKYIDELDQVGVYISISYDKEKKWENMYYFVRANEFKYAKNEVSLVLNQNKRQIHLKSTFLARDVYVLCDNEDEIPGLSNNYFDILPFQDVILYTIEEIKCQLKYYSLNDLFEQNINIYQQQ